MSEISKIIFSVLLTSFMSFVAFLLSKMYYRPIEKYKELRFSTSYILVYYANAYSNPINLTYYNGECPEYYKNASEEIRKLASEWRALIYLKSFPGFFLPRDKVILEVSKSLIGLSNSMILPYGTGTEANNYVDEIKKNLKLKS